MGSGRLNVAEQLGNLLRPEKRRVPKFRFLFGRHTTSRDAPLDITKGLGGRRSVVLG